MFFLWLLAGLAVTRAWRVPLHTSLPVGGAIGLISAAAIWAKWRR